jgi:hypothetical protein
VSRSISGTNAVATFLKTQHPDVETGLRAAVKYLDELPQVLEGCPVAEHPELREWLFDAAGKTWRMTIDVRTKWPHWCVMTVAEFR